jgi:hypothetical protein
MLTESPHRHTEGLLQAVAAMRKMQDSLAAKGITMSWWQQLPGHHVTPPDQEEGGK